MLELSKELQAILKVCKGKNHPKIELNFVFRDKESYVALNAISMIIIKHDFEIEGENIFYMDEASIKKVNIRTEKLKLDAGATVAYEADVGKYPDYSVFVPKNISMEVGGDFLELDNMLELLYCIQIKHGFAIHHKQTPILTALEKIKLEAGATYNFNSCNEPVTIKNGDITFVIMPYILKKK